MKNAVFIMSLVIMLTACAPTQANPADVQNTAIALAWTDYVHTQTALPKATLPPPATSIPPTDFPTPLPTQPIIPMITPDLIQMEKWTEYQTALATALFSPKYIPQSPGEFLCEWEILGQSDQEVYVWAVCMSIFSAGSNGLPYHGEMPVVIHIGEDGSVQRVEIPRGGTHYASDIREMFPPAAQERYFGKLIPFRELTDHLRWRRTHPEEPPLIVLSAMSTTTPTPLPTQPIIPMITPESIQVERWKEYEDALAKNFFSSLTPKSYLCEWDILGRIEKEIYVWAICDIPEGGRGASAPAIIYLNSDGLIENVKILGKNSDYGSDILKLPMDVQQKLIPYQLGMEKALWDHIEWRRTHPEEPPLIILSATSTATPTP